MNIFCLYVILFGAALSFANLSWSIDSHAYIENSQGIFYIDDPMLASDPHQFNACREKINNTYAPGTSLYSSVASNRMKANVFNVINFGSFGTGTSHFVGTTPLNCPHSSCGSSFVNSVRDFGASLTLSRNNYVVSSSGGNSRTVSFPAGIWPDDEWDWVAIQSALTAAANAGGGTVIIPDTGKDYLLSRSLWISSNTKLVWQTNSNLKTHSYLRITRPT